MTVTLAECVRANTDSTRGVFLYPAADGAWAVCVLDMSYEEAAMALYRVADTIIDEKTAPLDRIKRLGR